VAGLRLRRQTKGVLAGGSRGGRDLTWADTHHPALSETGGDYDGKFLFIGDKANARVAVIDLKTSRPSRS
jgi:nitrous-oxide reductase